MSYTKQVWANGPEGGTPFTAARGDHIEDGIASAHDAADAAQTVAVAAGDAAAAASSGLASKADVSALASKADVSALDSKADVGHTHTPASIGAAAAAHTHTAADVSDSTATGRSVLTAASPAAARTAIGAGTSDLTLGTTAGTAKAGNYAPTKADVGLGSVDNTADSAKPVSTAQQTALDAKPARALTKRTVTAAYTLVAADATDMVLHSTAASAVTITLPQDSAVTIAQEVAIPWRQYGAGQVTFAAGTGTTLISRGSVFKSAGQYAEGLVTKTAASTWLLSGDIGA